MDELAAMPEQQRAAAMQQMQIVPGDPRLQQVIRIDNDITDMDIDITIEEGIDVPSIQAEQFQVLIQLAGTQPGLIPPEILIASSNLRNKDELLEMLKEHQQAAAQQQQTQQKMVADKAQADITAQQGKAAADFALAKERQHAVVHHIADVHTGWNDMNAPPDPPERSWGRSCRRRFRRRWTVRSLGGCTPRRRSIMPVGAICGRARCSVLGIC